MTNLQAAFGFLIVFVAADPAIGQDKHAWVPGERVELVYDVFAGGRIAEMSLEFGVVGSNYNISTRQTSAGVLNWIWPWQSSTDVRGRFIGRATQPEAFRVNGQSRGKVRSVEMDYRDGELLRVETIPTNQDDNRDEVTPEQRRGAIDPASAIMSVIRQINEGQGCDARTPVFDGRQRYDIVFADRGMGEVASDAASIFKGEARICEFHWVPIAGRLRRPGMPVRADGDRRSGRAYMAEFGAGSAKAPVRIEFEAWFGTVVGHLREVRNVGQAAAID
jgi:hypothetical protein